MDPKEIEAAVEEFVGVPYRHGGRAKDGLDCLGLACAFYEKFGIRLPDGDGEAYGTDWYKLDPDRLLRGIESHGKPAPLSGLNPLDLVYFRIGGAVTHVGVMIDHNNFIHVLKGEKVHVSRLNLPWRRRLVGARRFL